MDEDAAQQGPPARTLPRLDPIRRVVAHAPWPHAAKTQYPVSCYELSHASLPKTVMRVLCTIYGATRFTRSCAPKIVGNSTTASNRARIEALILSFSALILLNRYKYDARRVASCSGPRTISAAARLPLRLHVPRPASVLSIRRTGDGVCAKDRRRPRLATRGFRPLGLAMACIWPRNIGRPAMGRPKGRG